MALLDASWKLKRMSYTFFDSFVPSEFVMFTGVIKRIRRKLIIGMKKNNLYLCFHKKAFRVPSFSFISIIFGR